MIRTTKVGQSIGPQQPPHKTHTRAGSITDKLDVKGGKTPTSHERGSPSNIKKLSPAQVSSQPYPCNQRVSVIGVSHLSTKGTETNSATFTFLSYLSQRALHEACRGTVRKASLWRIKGYLQRSFSIFANGSGPPPPVRSFFLFGTFKSSTLCFKTGEREKERKHRQ